jgi:hypothetical protein
VTIVHTSEKELRNTDSFQVDPDADTLTVSLGPFLDSAKHSNGPDMPYHLQNLQTLPLARNEPFLLLDREKASCGTQLQFSRDGNRFAWSDGSHLKVCNIEKVRDRLNEVRSGS